MEPRERSPSEARFFSGRGGCPGRGEPCRVGPWWLLWPGAVARKPWGRKPLSAAPDAVRGVLGGWGAPWELPGRVPRSSPGGRPLPMGAVPKPRKAWLLRGPRASGGPTRDSSCLWRAEWSSAGGRCGRPGPSVLGPVNSLVPRRLPGGRLPPSRARVGWGLVSTHRCSVDGALVGRQNGQRGPRCEEMARNQPHVSGLGKTGLGRWHAPGPRLPPPPALLVTRRVRPLCPVRLSPACSRLGLVPGPSVRTRGLTASALWPPTPGTGVSQATTTRGLLRASSQGPCSPDGRPGPQPPSNLSLRPDAGAWPSRFSLRAHGTSHLTDGYH